MATWALNKASQAFIDKEMSAMAEKILTGYGWYRLENTIQTNISRDYLTGEKSWNEWAAMRECLQNAADEAEYMVRTFGGTLTDYVHVSLRSGNVMIQDFGRGVTFENIVLLGKSDKRGQGYRGEKGEGQLMAFLTLAKLGVGIKMFSLDWMCQPTFTRYNGGANEVLSLELYRQANPENPKRLSKGTVWLIERTATTEGVVKDLESYFPDLAVKVSKAAERKVEALANRQSKEYVTEQRKSDRKHAAAVRRVSTSSIKTIIQPKDDKPARLYLKGIWVKDLTVATGFPCLFSYNLRNVSINRDRDMVNQFELLREVKKALSSDEVTKAMVEMYWQRSESADIVYQEYTVDPTPHNPQTWKAAFAKAFGKKVCLRTNSYAARDALAEGWKVVDLLRASAKVAGILGIPTDVMAGGYVGNCKPAKMNARDIKILNAAIDICKGLVDEMPVVAVVDKTLDTVAEGWYKDGEVYIQHRVFKDGLEVLRVILHESGHHNTKASDFNRPFTAWFLAGWMKALMNPDAKLTAKLEELRNM
jgi:hypothetical protein